MSRDMQQGRGGMGSHKHGISGRSGRSSGMKQSMARDANREAERTKRRKRPLQFNTVREAVKNWKKS